MNEPRTAPWNLIALLVIASALAGIASTAAAQGWTSLESDEAISPTAVVTSDFYAVVRSRSCPAGGSSCSFSPMLAWCRSGDELAGGQAWRQDTASGVLTSGLLAKLVGYDPVAGMRVTLEDVAAGETAVLRLLCANMASLAGEDFYAVVRSRMCPAGGSSCSFPPVAATCASGDEMAGGMAWRQDNTSREPAAQLPAKLLGSDPVTGLRATMEDIPAGERAIARIVCADTTTSPAPSMVETEDFYIVARSRPDPASGLLTVTCAQGDTALFGMAWREDTASGEPTEALPAALYSSSLTADMGAGGLAGQKVIAKLVCANTCAAPPCVGPAPVPKTGLTTSYEAGDDGDLRQGVPWPIPRFTDNGDGTVTDNLTGLVWLRRSSCPAPRGPWWFALETVNGLADPACGLSDGSIAGDWRLPNLLELASLIALGYRAPALANTEGTARWTNGDPFTNVQWRWNDYAYWTSTTAAHGNALNLWLVHFGDRGAPHLEYGHKNRGLHALWPVRGGQ